MENLSQFRSRCRAAGLAVTHQREVIYTALMSMRNHPSPETIYETVREQIPSISLGTVYKNIHTFLEAGLLKELSLHHGTLRLETNLTPHHHLVCTRCKAILDIDSAAVGDVHLHRQLPRGFTVSGYSVEFYGLCPNCKHQS